MRTLQSQIGWCARAQWVLGVSIVALSAGFVMLGFRPNDDHAPGDIKDGQDLVLAVHHALATGPLWDRRC